MSMFMFYFRVSAADALKFRALSYESGCSTPSMYMREVIKSLPTPSREAMEWVIANEEAKRRGMSFKNFQAQEAVERQIPQLKHKHDVRVDKERLIKDVEEPLEIKIGADFFERLKKQKEDEEAKQSPKEIRISDNITQLPDQEEEEEKGGEQDDPPRS